ncbi:MAG: ferrochelatase [Rhodospirillaceae bacterium]|nr:ferrochelatase [Rhodospirillaceae bacterium]
MTDRTAVVLFNLGGPDRPESIRPFLFNLFNDPAIVRQPGPVRWALARAISWRRAPEAGRIYARLGGRSPLLEQTEAQAGALERVFADPGTRTFVSMRYWHPMADAVVSEVARFDPAKVVLLPLYPQFSSSTTASSFRDWDRAARGILEAPTARVCCYPDEPGFVEAAAGRISDILRNWEGPGPRILYSAHGVPKAFVEAGDPYREHVERSAAAIRRALRRDDLEQTVCYQSRVGPLEWIGPYTDREIRRAGSEGKPLIVAPIAFVSEHSETLVELDEDYRELARESGVPVYRRAATVGTDSAFIGALAALVRRAVGSSETLLNHAGARICGTDAGDCPLAAGRAA